MNIVIEKAREEDRAGIFVLLQQANMHHVPSKEMPQITYENYFVAKDGDNIVGFCGYIVLSPAEAKTELMVVDGKYRGHGIGYALQERRMEDMLHKGIRTLTTNADIPASIAWYKKHFGYRDIGKLKKLHEFGDPHIDHWTTLQTDLHLWDANRRQKEE
jgi:N-acetylglutamate synthase-like GNAT family acetyltransferase